MLLSRCVALACCRPQYLNGSTMRQVTAYHAAWCLVHTQVWHYDDGVAVAVGRGHSGKVNNVCIAPDGNTVVSVGGEGGIFIWTIPDTTSGQPAHS